MGVEGRDSRLVLLQKVLLDALNEIDGICRENNIHYYMANGTLLGAARHKGFIPWDSDIDITMLREDYARFTDACLKKLSPLFTIMNPKMDLRSPVHFTRILVNGTMCVPRADAGRKRHEGLYVDIYPLDSAPEQVGLLTILKDKYTKLLCRIYAFRKGDVATKTKARRVTLETLSVLFAFASTETIYRLLARTMTRGPRNSTYVTIYGNPYGSIKERKLRADYEAPIELEFEGGTYWAPRNFDKVLTDLYGDYMQIPPKHERKGIDLDDYLFDVSQYLRMREQYLKW